MSCEYVLIITGGDIEEVFGVGKKRVWCVDGMGCPLLSSCWCGCDIGKCRGFCCCCELWVVVLVEDGDGMSVSPGMAPCHGNNLLM